VYLHLCDADATEIEIVGAPHPGGAVLLLDRRNWASPMRDFLSVMRPKIELVSSRNLAWVG
jgi:hypothetical protein